MNRLCRYTTVLLLMAFVLIACNKERPAATALPAQEQPGLVNTWRLEKATYKGVEVSSAYRNIVLQVAADGTVFLSGYYKSDREAYEVNTTGDWKLLNNPEFIEFNFELDQTDGVFRIIKREKNRLVLQHMQDQFVYEFKCR